MVLSQRSGVGGLEGRVWCFLVDWRFGSLCVGGYILVVAVFLSLIFWIFGELSFALLGGFAR